MLRAFARVKTTMPNALAMLAPRHPERFGEVERLAREAGLRHRAAIGAADRRRAARRRRRARHDRRAGAALPGGDGRVRRRQPRGPRRPQHPRAGDLRQADCVRARTCRTSRRLPTPSSPTARPCRCSPSASSTKPLLTLVADPVRQARLGAAARALVEANRGAKDKTLAVLADLLPLLGAGAVVRPFRLVH